MPPLLADFIHAGACIPICEKFLTRPFRIINNTKSWRFLHLKCSGKRQLFVFMNLTFSLPLGLSAMNSILKKSNKFFPNSAKRITYSMFFIATNSSSNFSGDKCDKTSYTV